MPEVVQVKSILLIHFSNKVKVLYLDVESNKVYAYTLLI